MAQLHVSFYRFRIDNFCIFMYEMVMKYQADGYTRIVKTYR
jgi:hypothetical protein